MEFPLDSSLNPIYKPPSELPKEGKKTSPEQKHKVSQDTSIIQSIKDKISSIFSKKTSEISMDSEVHFIGGVTIPSQEWKGNLHGTEKGKSLYLDRYRFEQIVIRQQVPVMKNGEQVWESGKEMHAYADSLGSTYLEWKQKLENKEFGPNDPSNPNEYDPRNRFDRYVEIKMQNDQEFRKKIEGEQVRFLRPEELKKTEASFSEKGEIQQIGLDNNDNSIKNLPKGQYAFVLGSKSPNPTSPKNEDDALDVDQYSLFLAKKGSTTEGKVQHSSFLSGGRVATAGIFEVNDQGKIEVVHQYSGHYQPTQEEMQSLVLYLRSKLNPDDYKNMKLKLNKYNGFMLRATMVINYQFEQIFKRKLTLGEEILKPEKWLRREGLISKDEMIK